MRPAAKWSIAERIDPDSDKTEGKTKSADAEPSAEDSSEKDIDPDSDKTKSADAEPQEEEITAAELGREVFHQAVNFVSIFTGTGTFSTCASGQKLVQLL